VETEISIQGSPGRLELPSTAWDAIAEATIEVSAPLRVADMEFDPADAPEVPLTPGRYLMQVYARTPETIARQRPQQTEWRDGVPWPEEHTVVFSPA
jgi:hypothetical protein